MRRQRVWKWVSHPHERNSWAEAHKKMALLWRMPDENRSEGGVVSPQVPMCRALLHSYSMAGQREVPNRRVDANLLYHKLRDIGGYWAADGSAASRLCRKADADVRGSCMALGYFRVWYTPPDTPGG